MHHILLCTGLLLFCCGCAHPASRGQGATGSPPGYALFSITLHCDDTDDEPVPSVNEMVEMELAGEPYLPAGELVAPEGWGVPYDSCSTLLESMREGASDLLPSARYERAQGY